MSFTFVTTLCFCLTITPIVISERDIGDQCVTSNGEKGTCTRQTDCIELENSATDGEFAETCKLHSDGTPIICCVPKNLPTKRDFATSRFGGNDYPHENVTETESRFYTGPKKKQLTKTGYKTTSKNTFYDNGYTNEYQPKKQYQSSSNTPFINNYDGYQPSNFVSTVDNYNNLHVVAPNYVNSYDNRVTGAFAHSQTNPFGNRIPNYSGSSTLNGYNNGATFGGHNTGGGYTTNTYNTNSGSINSNNRNSENRNGNPNSNRGNQNSFNSVNQPDNSDNVYYPGPIASNRPTDSVYYPNNNRDPYDGNQRPSGGNNNQNGFGGVNGWESQNGNRKTTHRPANVDEEPIWGTTPRTTTRRVTNTVTSSQRPSNRPTGFQQQNRISEQKCSEYTKSVKSTVSALPLLINGQVTSQQVQSCSFAAASLIVGGTKAQLGQYPHMAALGFRNGNVITYNCGGTIISEDYILTAAHCTHSTLGNPVVARVGDLNLERDDDGAQPQTINIAKVTVHPNYKPPQLYNDIALVRLSRKINFNKNLRPACLHTVREINAPKVVATGWGSTNYGEITSDDLLQVSLDIIDNNQCNSLYGPDQKLQNGISNNILCAGELSGKKDTCQGDSGGPLQIHDPSNKCIHYVVGITSSGKSCGVQNSPGIYTRVSEYIPWIENIVWRS